MHVDKTFTNNSESHSFYSHTEHFSFFRFKLIETFTSVGIECAILDTTYINPISYGVGYI
jgi:hypothetical protein